MLSRKLTTISSFLIEVKLHNWTLPNDHQSTTATIFGFRYWTLLTGLTVFKRVTLLSAFPSIDYNAVMHEMKMKKSIFILLIKIKVHFWYIYLGEAKGKKKMKKMEDFSSIFFLILGFIHHGWAVFRKQTGMFNCTIANVAKKPH